MISRPQLGEAVQTMPNTTVPCLLAARQAVRPAVYSLCSEAHRPPLAPYPAVWGLVEPFPVEDKPASITHLSGHTSTGIV